MNTQDSLKDQAENAKWEILLFVMTPILMIAGGWIRSHLWKWFLVPLGFPAIGTLEMAGIFILSKSMWTTTLSDTVTAKKTFIKTLVNFGLTLGLGYLFHKL